MMDYNVMIAALMEFLELKYIHVRKNLYRI